MSSNYKIDNLDLKILDILQKDSRKSFQEIARDLVVSGGTIHVRVNKLKEKGIIKGSKLIIDYSNLGFKVNSFIGINLHSAKDTKEVTKKLNMYPEVIEVHETTGKYSLFIKILTKDIESLHRFIVESIHGIPEIQSTETIISLSSPLNREIQLASIKADYGEEEEE